MALRNCIPRNAYYPSHQKRQEFISVKDKLVLDAALEIAENLIQRPVLEGGVSAIQEAFVLEARTRVA